MSCVTGPRFVLNPIRMFEGSFGGATLYVNPKYVSPNEVRCDQKCHVTVELVNSHETYPI